MPKYSDAELSSKRFKMVSYHKYRLSDGTVNPKVDQNSRWLMDLKSPANPNFGAAVKAFSGRLQKVALQLFDAGQSLQVAIVPSHTAGQHSSGLLQIVQSLQGDFKLNCSLDFLQRHTTIPALKDGGNRSLSTHLESIQVAIAVEPNTRLLVLDDVSTSGNSLLACRALLMQAGVKVVALMALGQAVSEED